MTGESKGKGKRVEGKEKKESRGKKLFKKERERRD
jgi:hypothetical protein